MKTALRTFWQSTIVGGLDFLEPSPEKLSRARVLVQFFYLLVLYLAFEANSVYSALPGWHELVDAKTLFEPHWNLRWISMDHWETIVCGIAVTFLVAAGLNAIYWRRSRALRVATFLSFFFYLSLISSFGRIYHYYHVMLAASFILIALPADRQGKADAAGRGFLEIILGIQAFMLLTYASSGFFKIFGLIKQVVTGPISALSPKALAIHSARDAMSSGNLEQAILACTAHEHLSIGWSLAMAAAFFVEFCSVYIIFRPAWHAVWAVGLVAMHLGIVLLVGPAFPMQALLVCLFLGMSPFALNAAEPARMKRWMPWIRSRTPRVPSEVIIFYDGQCLMCNGFIKRIASYTLPAAWKIATIQGSTYRTISDQFPGLQALDSLIIVERAAEQVTMIRTKSDGVTWCLAQLSPVYRLLRVAHLIAPYPSRFVYDVVAKNRVRTAPDACPIPPPAVKERLLED